jgi:phospholipase/carboxylesterase
MFTKFEPVKIGDLDFLKLEDNPDKPAVILIHGYGANYQDLASLSAEIAPEDDWNWYFPNGHLEIPLGFMMTGRAWFPIDMEAFERAQREGTFRIFKNIRPEGFDEAMTRLENSVTEICQKHKTVILGGFSQGAMIASHLGLKMGDKIKGLLLFSANFVDENSMKEIVKGSEGKPFFQSHGTQDPILNILGGKELYEFLIENGLKGDFYDFQGGHGIDMGSLEGAKKLLTQFT